MKSIFENARFGDKFRTRDGRMALYHCYDERHNKHFLFFEGYSFQYGVCPDGKRGEGSECNNDIVSEWEEEINEEELEKLADEYEDKVQSCFWWSSEADCVCDSSEVRIAFKAGYRKANNKCL